jgi:hypothetical protein
MKNKAKCKLCKSVIESFHHTDFVPCACGEIAVDGGDSLKCYANDFSNFLRIDDNGNEVEVVVKSSDINAAKQQPEHYSSTPNRRELIEQLAMMAENIEKLPPHALANPISHYDFFSLLALLTAILRSDLRDEI